MKGSIIIMKQKHLTLEERETIEDMLKENINFTEIGKVIGKSRIPKYGPKSR